MSDFDWEEYLTFAHALIRHQQDLGVSPSAIHRNAISRAYYAAHNRAREWYGKQLGASEPAHRLPGHEELIDALSQEGRTGAKMTNCLNELKVWRRKADYDSHAPGLTQQTSSLLNKARTVIDLTKKN